MMKFKFLIISTIALAFSQASYAQNDVEIIWSNPTEYRDVRSANGGKKKFMDSTFKHINDYMVKLAKDLPEEYKLVLTVTDLDLAGQVWPASFAGLGRSMSEIRVIKSIDIPRINFNYQLLTTGGIVVQQADVKLRDMSFMERSHIHFDSDTLRYEKRMLKQWFQQEFKKVVKDNF